MGSIWISIASVSGDVIEAKPSQLNDKANYKTITDFVGEKLVYDISFLWFKNAAEGSTILQRDEENYIAKLEAETKGFIGFITGYIKHLYVSRMNMVGENTGLQPYLFEKKIVYRRVEEKVTTTLDYENRIMSWHKTEIGEIIDEDDEEEEPILMLLSEDKENPIPLSIVYYDILSVLYNFRTSYYGEIQKGKDFLIHTIPEKNESEIHIHVGTREEELKFKKEEHIEDSEGYFLIIKIPKEIFKTKRGEMLIWGDKNLLPLKVIVRDYIGFGDVRGTLREVVRIK